jgi:hypothetical protein
MIRLSLTGTIVSGGWVNSSETNLKIQVVAMEMMLRMIAFYV